MDKKNIFLILNLFFIGFFGGEAWGSPCNDRLSKEIHRLILSDHSNILSLQYEITLLKLSMASRDKIDSYHNKKNKDFIGEAYKDRKSKINNLAKVNHSVLLRLENMYKHYGKNDDLGKIAENIDSKCRESPKRCHFYEQDASAYIQAGILLSQNENDFDEKDAAIIWLSKNATNSNKNIKLSQSISEILLHNSTEKKLNELTKKINSEYNEMTKDFSASFKKECLSRLLKSCKSPARLVGSQMVNQINRLVNDLKIKKIINLNLENHLKENLAGKIEFSFSNAEKKDYTPSKKTELVNTPIDHSSRDLSHNKDGILEEKNSTKIEIIDPDYKTDESIAFVAALSSEKSKLMKLYHLSNKDYDELARYAFGVAGVESSFATGIRWNLKQTLTPFGVASLKESKASIKQIAKEIVKGNKEGGVLDAMVAGGKTYVDRTTATVSKVVSGQLTANNSYGLTQIKNIPNLIKKSYGIKEDSELRDPKISAVATIGYLAEALIKLKKLEKINPDINESNRLDYISYIYTGKTKQIINRTATPEKNIYLRNLKKFEAGISIQAK